MRPLASCDISLQFNRCRCRCLNPNTWESLNLKDCKEYEELAGLAVNLPIIECDGLVGFFVDDIATEIKPKVNALNGIKRDYCD